MNIKSPENTETTKQRFNRELYSEAKKLYNFSETKKYDSLILKGRNRGCILAILLSSLVNQVHLVASPMIESSSLKSRSL